MDDNYEGQELKRTRKKKFRFGRFLFTLIILAAIAIGIYIFIQYNAGRSIAQGNVIEPGSFSGDGIDPNYPSIENYLLLGVDDDGSEKSRTDTMMLLSWDKTEGTMKVISFMRDIYAEIPGYKSYKLNTAYYLGGVQTTKDTITGMFGVPIHHYAIVDFDNFEAMVDIAFPQGVEMNVQKEMSEKIGVTLTPGKKNLNGQELLGYARFRADTEGDFGRVRRQQEVIQAIKKAAFRPSMIATAPKLAGALSQYIQTDLSAKDEITRVLTLAIKKGADIDTMTIPADNTYSYEKYSHAGSVLEVDIIKNKEILSDFLNMQLE